MKEEVSKDMSSRRKQDHRTLVVVDNPDDADSRQPRENRNDESRPKRRRKPSKRR